MGRWVSAVAMVLLCAGCVGDRPAPSEDFEATGEAEPSDDGRTSVEGTSSTGCLQLDNITLECRYHGDELARVSLAGSYQGDANGQRLPVSNITESIDATLTWTSPANTLDLDLAISFPGCRVIGVGLSTCLGGGIVNVLTPGLQVVDEDGTPGFPDSPARLSLDRQDIVEHLECDLPGAPYNQSRSSCDWWVFAQWSEQVTAQVSWDLVVRLTLRLQEQADG